MNFSWARDNSDKFLIKLSENEENGWMIRENAGTGDRLGNPCCQAVHRLIR
ncbi:MAG: hypothetical protein ACRC8Y_13530 [Chroococcales cyanobacterium]